MHSDYYSKVKDLISREDFDKLVRELDIEFNGLLEKEILEYLIVDEMGRNRGSIVPISQIKPDQSCTVFGKVMEISENSNCISLIISDNTLSCFLNLWNRNADIGREIKILDTLKVINAYSRLGKEGLEINAGRWSYIEINPEDAPSIEIKPVCGTLIRKEETRVRFDGTGCARFFKRIWLEENDTTFHVNVWDDHVKLINQISEGDFLKIKNPVRRIVGSKIEIEARAGSKITTKS